MCTYLTAGYVPCACQVNNIKPPRVYLEAWVGYEPGVITQVGGVVLHHALSFWLAEVLVGRRETSSCQHHSGGLWERDTKFGGGGNGDSGPAMDEKLKFSSMTPLSHIIRRLFLPPHQQWPAV